MTNDTQWYEEVDFVPVKTDVVYQIGDESDAVEAIQNRLRLIGYDLSVDGVYGQGTARTVRQFQKDRNLVTDGRVGPKTLRRLRIAEPDPKVLTQDDLEAAADKLGVPVAAMMAVNEVESRGSGFLDDGRPVILFERHIMLRRLKANNVDPSRYDNAPTNIVSTSTGGYEGGVEEHDRLAIAEKIDPTSAIESASWGLGQVMGMHWKRLGYANASEFRRKMERSEADQLDAVVRYIAADETLVTAMREQDWATFARYYNGPNYAKNRYDEKLSTAYSEHQRELA